MFCSGLTCAEVVEDVAVEGELHAFTCDFLKLLHSFALKTGIIDQDIKLSPFAQILIENLPAMPMW